MPSTTNFNWTTPADTDLVKNGAAAIRTLGNGIDTSFVDLKGGTTGQLLSKASNTDLDFSWTTVSSGGMTLLATVDASAATTVSFTSIPTDNKQLIVVWNNAQISNTTDYYKVELNSDSGTNYHYNGLLHRDATTPAGIAVSGGTSFGNSNSNAPLGGNATSATESFKNRGFFTIYNADQTSGRKTVFYRNNYRDDSYGQTIRDVAGEYIGTSAVSRIDFIRSGTPTITGTFRLYGVK